MTLLYLPAPPISSVHLGPLTIHFYSLCLILAVAVAGFWAIQRFAARGGERDRFDGIFFAAVIAGVVGARIYHVITEHERYFGSGVPLWHIFAVWRGGLGIIGGVIGGALGVYWICRRNRWNFLAMADVIAPTLLIAQAIGRVGNWFNQEVFGVPTQLPWALEVDPAFRPPGYEEFATFHPTFLYEGLWNLVGLAVLILLERRFALRHGQIFCGYLLWYSLGRFALELIRIDPVNMVGGLRINAVALIPVFGAALVAWILLGRKGSRTELPFATPISAQPTQTELSEVAEGPEPTAETENVSTESPNDQTDPD